MGGESAREAGRSAGQNACKQLANLIQFLATLQFSDKVNAAVDRTHHPLASLFFSPFHFHSFHPPTTYPTPSLPHHKSLSSPTFPFFVSPYTIIAFIFIILSARSECVPVRCDELNLKLKTDKKYQEN